MKVIKRDGRVVPFDLNKILVAIRKANVEVDSINKIAEEKIEDIAGSIAGMKREKIQVEDIQDLIEQKLMAEGK